MDLFLDKPLEFEKVGYDARMSEDPNKWPQEILDELFRQAPFASDYAPRVVLRTIEPDKRYALGQVELMNQLAINPRDDSTPKEMRGQQKVVVPIIIRDGKLKPMDILIHSGKAEPLTEDRLRKAMFRPVLFDAIRKKPGDMSLIEQLYPPHRQYGGSRGMLVGDMGKMGSAKPPMLMDAILPTIKQAHVKEVTSLMNDDPSLRAALLHNDATRDALAKLATVEGIQEETGMDYLRKVAHSIHPTVVQIQRIQGGFRIKTAAPDALIPTSDDVDRPMAEGLLGGDMVNEVERDGTVTMTSQPAVKDTLEDVVVKVVDEFGLYKVRTVGDNKELIGWVFPKVVDLDGTVLPMAVFSNGSQSCMQENIAGTPVDRSTAILDAPPKGVGCFYYTTGSGATGLVPVSIAAEIETPDGEGYQAETVMGETCIIVKMDGLKTVEQVGNGRYAIPADCGFMPLENLTDLLSVPEDFAKTAAAREFNSRCRVLTDGVCYTFYGPEISKVAKVMKTEFLDKDEAVFLGTILGQEPTKMAHLLDDMRGRGNYDTTIQVRPVTAFSEKYAAAKSRASEILSKMPDIRATLLKEAAPLDDPTTVDKVLSVNFINPENVSIFASYIPEIEETIQKLSELLVASRMGMESVDQGALEKSLVHLDKVVSGLKTMTSVAQA